MNWKKVNSMEKEKLESLLIDYIDGQLGEADKAMVEQELATNPLAATLHRQLKEVMDLMSDAKAIAPRTSLKANFEKALEAEISQAKSGKQVYMQSWVLRVAAAVALIVVAVVVGDRVLERQEHAKQIAEFQKQLDDQKKIMMAMLENRESASQRVMGATVAYEMKQADDDIVNALVKAMQQDPSTNVRLSALEALHKFYQQSLVRTQLIRSLATQKDPVVQIALIQLLVEMKEKGVVNELEKITRDDTVIKAVKDEAHTGILRLS